MSLTQRKATFELCQITNKNTQEALLHKRIIDEVLLK